MNREMQVFRFLVEQGPHPTSSGAYVTPEVPVDSEKPSWFPEGDDFSLLWLAGENGIVRDLNLPDGFIAHQIEADAIAAQRFMDFPGDAVPWTENFDDLLNEARREGYPLLICDGDLNILDVFR